jgi:hypothetical protein
MSRLTAMASEVAALEGQITALRGSAAADLTHAGSEGAVPAAVVAAEAEARDAERAKWAALVDAERSSGDRRVAEVRAAGKQQYSELVKSIEARYVAEFEGALTQVRLFNKVRKLA